MLREHATMNRCVYSEMQQRMGVAFDRQARALQSKVSGSRVLI